MWGGRGGWTPAAPRFDSTSVNAVFGASPVSQAFGLLLVLLDQDYPSQHPTHVRTQNILKILEIHISKLCVLRTTEVVVQGGFHINILKILEIQISKVCVLIKT